MKVLSLAIFLTFILSVHGQDHSDNALYPNQLLVTNICPLDDYFLLDDEKRPWSHMYFQKQQPDGTNLSKNFVEQALHSGKTAYELNTSSDFFPYDLKTNKILTGKEVEISFGAKDFEYRKGNGQKFRLVQDFDTNEIAAVEFIEEWVLDTMRQDFKKVVHAFIPLIKQRKHNDTGYLIGQTCAITQSTTRKASKNPELIARVKYEVLLFDNVGNLASGLSNTEENIDNLFSIELHGSPFFSSYSRYRLINFVKEVATKQKLLVCDFETNTKIEDVGEINSRLGELLRPVAVQNLVENRIDTMTVVEYSGEIKSVIFCEEWYVDTKTGYFSKEVVGIAPVLWEYNSHIKNAAYVIWFAGSKMF